MDVLLQLTLPIVLILAFLVVTEVQTLTDQIGRLKREIEGTATGRLTRERDLALLDLQRQLLSVAAREVAEDEAEDLALREYERYVPQVADILAGEVAPRFAEISVALARALGGDEELRGTEERLRRSVEERFGELAGERTSLAGPAARALLQISDDNRRAYETEIKGFLERFVQEGADVQLALMLDWLGDRAVPVEQQSVSLWRLIQRRLLAADEEDPPDARFAEFVNLKANALVSTLRQQGVPLLERTLQQSQL